MKKLLTLIVCVCLGIGLATARDHSTRNVKELPAQAQAMLANNFGKVGVNHIKIDRKAFGGSEYDVILNDGTEIEFDGDGQWKEIDCGASAVPNGLILKPISQYVGKNFPGSKIVKIERNRNDYDVELSSGIELKFGRDGRFIRVDD